MTPVQDNSFRRPGVGPILCTKFSLILSNPMTYCALVLVYTVNIKSIKTTSELMNVSGKNFMSIVPM